MNISQKKLGKETIDTNTYGQSRGRNGNYSTNWQITGRELMTPDEVSRMDNKYALLFIRGERPISDLKFDILKHPYIALTTKTEEPNRSNTEDSYSHASIEFSHDAADIQNAVPLDEIKLTIYSSLMRNSKNL